MIRFLFRIENNTKSPDPEIPDHLRGCFKITQVQKDTVLDDNSHTGCLVLSLGFAVRLNS